MILSTKTGLTFVHLTETLHSCSGNCAMSMFVQLHDTMSKILTNEEHMEQVTSHVFFSSM